VGPKDARAAIENKPIHHSADHENWDRKTNKVEMIGHAVVREPGETLTADYMILDLNLRTLDARGNCVYTSAEALMYGEEMHFNLDTRTGSIVGGRVSNDKFTLSGERINKLGEGRFQTHWGEYTTCRDCGPSWSLMAEDVDLQFDGYAFMSNVTTKIKDASAFWLPYLIVPVKSRRQTGLLFPTISTGGENGFSFVLPFFWAINRSADMTFGVGDYTAKGLRLEWEGRYALSRRSGGKANFYYLHDRVFEADNAAPGGGNPGGGNPTSNPNRWGLVAGQLQELPLGIDEKLKVEEVSDQGYPVKFPADIPDASEPVLESSMSFSHTSDDFSAFVQATRIRDMLYYDYANGGLRAFNPNTVQVLPSLGLSSNDRSLFGTPIIGGLSMEAANFARQGTPTSTDFLNPSLGNVPGNAISLLREAKRLSITPELYTTLRPFDSISLVPSAQYRSYFYNFNDQVPNLFRSYLLLQLDASTQLERIYTIDNPDYPRVKHLIRPMLTFSWIPQVTVRDDPNHQFDRQIAAMGPGRSGYDFDDNDIIPRDNSTSEVNYFVPLGESVAYGFTTQLIQRHGADDAPSPSYLTLAELSAGQAFNFLQYTGTNDRPAPDNPQPFSRLFTHLNLNLNGKLTSDTTYYYYPYADPGKQHTITTTATYILERAVHQRILTYDRSLSLTYALDRFACTSPDVCTEYLSPAAAFSINDYILPTISAQYTWIGDPRWLLATADLKFQSPSQCWVFDIGGTYTFPNQGFAVSFNLSLNLTGTGFGGISEVASQAMRH
jgi:hypothetical protein